MGTWKTALATVAVVAAAALAGPGGLAANALADTDTVTITPAANPTLLEPTTVDVDGTAAAGEKLQVWVSSDSNYPCELGPNAVDAEMPDVWLAQDQALPGGAFHQTFSYTLGATFGWVHYRICAWVQSAGSGSPIGNANDEVDLTGGQPAGTVSIALNGSPQRTVATSVTISGSTDVARRVYAGTTGQSVCGDDWLDYGVRTPWDDIGPQDGTPVGPGPFSVTFPWTPNAVYGAEGICAFLQGDGTQTGVILPIASHTAVTVGDPPIPPKVVPPPPPPAPPFRLTAPAEFAKGTLLDPVFAWPAPAGALAVPAGDEFALARDDGSRSTTIVRITKQHFTVLAPQLASHLLAIVAPKGKAEPTSQVARLALSHGQVTLKLRSGIAPGVYTWVVAKPGGAVDARSFTVLAPKVGKVSVKVTTTRHKSTFDAASAGWKISGLPYGHVVMKLRRGTGRTITSRFVLDHTGRDVLQDDYGCSQAGQTVAWSIAVTDDFGKTKRRSGRFTTVARSYCAELVHEQQVSAERKREQQRQQAEQNREAVDRYTSTCRSYGGFPEELDDGAGYITWVCDVPGGGGATMYVPGYPDGFTITG